MEQDQAAVTQADAKSNGKEALEAAQDLINQEKQTRAELFGQEFQELLKKHNVEMVIGTTSESIGSATKVTGRATFIAM